MLDGTYQKTFDGWEKVELDVGYWVASEETEMDSLDIGEYLGVWTDENGKVWYDKTHFIFDRETAIILGIRWNQLAIYDNKNKNAKTKKKRSAEKSDYYFHVNNSWITQNKLAKNISQKNDFVILKKKVNKQLFEVLKEVVKDTSSPNSKRCKQLYESMTNWNDSLVSDYFYLFQRKIEEFRKNSETHNLYAFLGWCIKNGVIAPIDFGLINDVKRPDRYIAAIGDNGFAFNSKDVYFGKNKMHADIRNNYKQFIHDTFVLFFGPNNCFDASDAFNVELKLAKYMYSLEDSVSPIKTYNRVNSNYVKQYCHLDFELLLKEINMENVKYVNIINPKPSP
jgi:predicted metalloendopeptidase